MVDLANLFKNDEISREIDPAWSKETLLEHDGLFSLSKVAEHLGLDKRKIREMAREEERAGVDIYERYGLKKIEGSQWKVLMRNFKKIYAELEDQFSLNEVRENIQRIPAELDREAFFSLRGYYKLKEVIGQGYLPFEHREVIAYLNRLEDPRREAGAWKGPKEWYVDFEPFIINLHKHFTR